MLKVKKDDFVAISNAQIVEYEAFLRHLDVIADVAKRMNGKVFNVRFKNAIDSTCEVVKEGTRAGMPRFRIHFDPSNMYKYVNGERSDYVRLWVSFYVQNRWVPLRTDDNGVTTGRYIDSGMYLGFCIDEAIVGGRIHADSVLSAVERKKEYVGDQILILKDAVKRFDHYKKAVETLEELIGVRASKINPRLRPENLYTFMTHQQMGANFADTLKK